MALSLGVCGSARWEGLVVQMGGGRRTYPGGVSKWEWKRLQEHKFRMREKEWLRRERWLYEKRKRQEKYAAMATLDKPWEQPDWVPPETPEADFKLSLMADRFRKPGSVDLWNERDGPVRAKMNFQRGDYEEADNEDDLFCVEEQEPHAELPSPGVPPHEFFRKKPWYLHWRARGKIYPEEEVENQDRMFMWSREQFLKTQDKMRRTQQHR